MVVLPGFTWIDNPRSGGGSYATDGPSSILLHMTVSMGLSASYVAGHPYPPHFWANPYTGDRWQTISPDRSAFALYQPSVSNSWTNKKGYTLQTELVGVPEVNVETYTDAHCRWIGEQVVAPQAAWLASIGRPVDLSQVAYRSDSSGSASEYWWGRMGEAEWDSFNGLCQHSVVPYNDHWDCSVERLDRIAAYANAALGGGSLGGVATPTLNGVPDGSDILAVQQWCAAHGCDPGPLDGVYGPMTAAGIAAWQTVLAKDGFNPGPIDGDWGSLTTAATAAWDAQQKEDDMFDDNDRAQLTHVFNIFNDGNRWNQWFNESRSAAGGIAFVQDPRDGKVWMVWGTMWKRHMPSPEILSGFQSYWGARGVNTALQVWEPIHIDSVPDANTLVGAAQANSATLAEVLALTKGDPPPAERVVDVEASLDQATGEQLIAAITRYLGKARPADAA